MSRPIKFRGLTLAGKMIEGCHCEWQGRHYIINDIWGFILVVPETVGQFTGLCNLAGKEIYGGHIVKMFHQEYMVVWDNREAGWYLQDEYKARIKLSHTNCGHCNIHEHKHLLEADK